MKNNKEYIDLLCRIVPSVIKTEEENKRLLSEVEKLMQLGENLTEAQSEILRLLAVLIEDYEEINYPMDKSTPHEILQHIMESSGIRQTDLVNILGSSCGVVSEIVKGKRSISKAQAKALGEYFKVSPSLFI